MTINNDALRVELTRAMAEAVDDVDTFEAYFGPPGENADYGVARADGSMVGDMLFLWEYAGMISGYIRDHGIDVLDLLEQAGNLFVAYQAVKAPPNDFTETDKEKIKEAMTEFLTELARERK